MASRWRKHDGSELKPMGLDADAVLELDGETWGVSAIPAGAIAWGPEIKRYRDTGARSSWRPDKQ